MNPGIPSHCSAAEPAGRLLERKQSRPRDGEKPVAISRTSDCCNITNVALHELAEELRQECMHVRVCACVCLGICERYLGKRSGPLHTLS